MVLEILSRLSLNKQQIHLYGLSLPYFQWIITITYGSWKDEFELEKNVRLVVLVGSQISYAFRRIAFHLDKSEKNDDKNLTILEVTSALKLSFFSRLRDRINEINKKTNQQKLTVFIPVRVENLFASEEITVSKTLTKLLTLSSLIFYVSTDENCHFDEAILNRNNKNEFSNLLWPSYTNVTSLLLHILTETNAHHKLYIIDNTSKNENSIQSAISHVENGIYLNKRFFMGDLTAVKERVSVETRRRDNHYVERLIKENKSNFFKFMSNYETDWFERLNKSRTQAEKTALIWQTVKEFEKRLFYNEEQKSVFKNVFTSGKNQELSIAGVLIDETIKLCRLLKMPEKIICAEEFREKPEPNSLNCLIFSVGEILINLTKHFIFRNHVFNYPSYPMLIREMLKTGDYLIRMNATRLITTMLNADHKRYGSRLMENDDSELSQSSLVQLIYSTVFDLFSLFAAPLKTLKHCEVINFIIENISYRSLELIFKGSLENCMKLSDNQVVKLVELSLSINKAPEIKCCIYGILNSLLKYGPKNIWIDKIDVVSLLNDVTATISHLARRESYKVLWTKTANFMKDLLTFLPRDSIGSVDFELSELKSDSDRFVNVLQFLTVDNLYEVFHLLKLHLLHEEDFSVFAGLVMIYNVDRPKFNITYSTLCRKIKEASLNLKVDFGRVLYNEWNKCLTSLFVKYNEANDKEEDILKARRRIVNLARLMGNLVNEKVFDDEIVDDFLKKLFQSDSMLGLKILFEWLKVVGKNVSKSEVLREGLEKLERKEVSEKKAALVGRVLRLRDNEFEVDVETQETSQTLVSALYSSILRCQTAKMELFDEESEKYSWEVLKIENRELRSEKAALTMRLRELEEKVEKLKLDLEEIEKDKATKGREVEVLREANQNLKRQMKTLSQVASFPTEKVHVGGEVVQKHPEIQASSANDDFVDDLVAGKKRIESVEQAKRFVDILRVKRENLKDFRKLICGDLEHLSVNLYTSPHHFLSEIVQNFEDNEYEEARRPWFAKLVLNAEFILFCNNEIGFQANHVHSICSSSESSKEKGKHIGNKGLGFKSVFLCSDTPAILSRPFWQFEFRKTPKNDEIAYITPLHLNTLPEPLTEAVHSDPHSNTFIYLPLKDIYKYRSDNQESVAYFQKILTNLEPNVLLFTNKLEKFVVEDKVHAATLKIECEKIEWRREARSYSALECVLRKERNDQVKQESRFRVFKKKVYIPDDLRGEERLECESTEIALAFPERLGEPCAVHACLPVCDLGFSFLINCNWSLVTSRESVNEHSRFNLYLREQVASLFVEVVSDEKEIQSRIVDYLPKEGVRTMSEWWGAFVRDVRFGLKTVLRQIVEANLNRDEAAPRLKTLLPDESLLTLMDEAFLRKARIKILQPEMNLDYEYFGFHKISIDDFISALSENSFDEMSQFWWEQFFRALNLSLDLDLNKVKLANIFCIDHKRSSINTDKPCFYFVSDNLHESWRENLKIIKFKSTSEKNFLIEKLKIPQLNPTLLIEFVKAVHLDAFEDLSNLGSVEQVWTDLNLVRKMNKDFNNELLLFAPSTSEKTFRPIRDLHLPSALGFDLKTAFFNSSKLDFIDFNLSLDLNVSLGEILQWEIFFVEMKCKIPVLDLTNLKQIFDLARFEESDAKLGLKLIDLIEPFELSKTIKLFLVKAECEREEVTVPVFETCLKKVFNSLLPSLELNEGSVLHLAERLGVTVRADLRSCAKVLRSLVSRRVAKPDLYVEWLLNLKTFLSADEMPELRALEILCLSDAKCESIGFYDVDRVYCAEETPGLLLICKYLDKTLVNFKQNRAFMTVESVLVQLGAKIQPSLEDIVQCLHHMSNDLSLYNNANKQSILSNRGSECFREVYAELEAAFKRELKVSDESIASTIDLKLRQEVIELVQSHARLKQVEFPIVTYDNHVLGDFDEDDEAFICFQFDIILTLKDKLQLGQFFVNPQIARQFPYLLGALPKASYLNSTFKIRLSHLSNNLEYTNENLNAEFRRVTKIPEVHVIKSNYLPISVSDIDDRFEENVHNNFKFGIFDNRLVVIPCRNVSDDALVMLIILALKQLLKVRDGLESSDEELLSEAKQVIMSMGKGSVLFKENWPVWSKASSDAEEFAFESVMFHEEENDSSVLNEFYFVESSRAESASLDEQKKQLKNRRVNNFYLNNELNFKTRVEELKNMPIKINVPLSDKAETDVFVMKERFQVNKKRQEQCGIDAEHFFCLNLKQKYGESFNEFENWVSSARNQVYPSAYPYDDRLGYDFKLYDFRNFFTEPDVHTKTCYIEVKGSDCEWDGKVHISHNEKDTRDKIIRDREAYLIVVVEWVSEPSMTRIARLVRWSDNLNFFSLTPETYLGTYKGHAVRSIEQRQNENYRSSDRNDNTRQDRHSDQRRGYGGNRKPNDSKYAELTRNRN